MNVAVRELSRAEELAQRSEAQRAKILAGISKEELDALAWDWGFWGRPKQQSPWHLGLRAPDGDEYFLWVLLSGRGFGKTRTAVENIARMLRGPTPLTAPPGAPAVMSIIADTPFDMRQYSIEGKSGFANVGPPEWRPTHHKSLKVLDWPCGCRALLFSAEDPEELRGASGAFFWWDELAKSRYAQAGWNNLIFGLREGNPRGIITTTPRPIPLLKNLIARPSSYVTKGSTWENKANISPIYYKEVIAPLVGTRLGRQEIDAEILDDSPDALWNRALIDRHRAILENGKPKLDENGHPVGYPSDTGTIIPLPAFRRIVVAIDPQGKKTLAERNKEGELDERAQRKRRETGISVCALGEDGRGYVLEDATINGKPHEWGNHALTLFDKYDADGIVGEVNNGGDMVEDTIRAIRPDVPFRQVRASRGKWVRAEPVSALYEQGKVTHVGSFPLLEDEMVVFEKDGMPDGSSPNRLDALVWALTELAIQTGGGVFDTSEANFVVETGSIPRTWGRVGAVVIEAGEIGVVWAALNRLSEEFTVIDEYATSLGQLAVHAEAIRKRGNWVPILFETQTGARKEEMLRVAHLLAELGLDVYTVPLDEASGIEAVSSRLATGQLKVFHPMPHWLAEYRSYRRTAEGEIDKQEPKLLMRATELIALHGSQVAISEDEATAPPVAEEDFIEERDPTGY